MYGAILGDMIGAPYEFDRSPKIKDFPLFSVGTEFTDDSVMTIAVAEALLNTAGKTDDEIRSALISSMRKWGKRYPGAGYGGRFSGWLRAKKSGALRQLRERLGHAGIIRWLAVQHNG